MSNLNQSYQWCIDKCNDPNVGYWQDYRNQKTVNGVTYYDCSSFIWYSLQAGGFNVASAYKTATGSAYTGNAITTVNMPAWMTALGWSEVPLSGEWKAGDVLWRYSNGHGHTEMVYEGGTGRGRTMGAHGRNPRYYPTLASQVSIRDSYDSASDWMKLYRYGSGGASSAPSIYVISAICGNWRQESTINAGLWEGRREGTWTELNHGYGIGQWTNTGGNTHGRLYQLHEWLVSNGYDIDDADAQIDYLIHEGTWYSTHEASSYRTLDDFLSSESTDIEALTHAFNIGWEGIHDASWNDRVTYALDIYDYLLQHADDQSITTWYKGNRYLTTAEMYNNAVLAYRHFNGMVVPPQPTPPIPPQPTYGKGKMPVWMMLRW